ncbi:MAG: protein phosphatase 2C domain-containing protein [Granulosicoccaceae bacterium]
MSAVKTTSEHATDRGTEHSTQWDSTASSVVGHVRKINEDAYLDLREQGLWVVADGMGGHSRGDYASQTIIEHLISFTCADNSEASLSLLRERLHAANHHCREQANGQMMGSTVAVLFFQGEHGYILWAGDSRIYRLRDGESTQITDDHSLVQELYRLGELTAEEAETHPSGNVITRAVGVADELDLQIRQLTLQAGDRFLICSDGLFKDVNPKELFVNFELPTAQHALDEMVDFALKRGGGDNITGIVVQIAA